MAVTHSKIGMTVVGLLISVAATGCCLIIPAKPIQPAYISAEPPYTARLMFPYKEGEKVRSLRIYEYTDIERFPGTKLTLRWHIKATKPVFAKGFKVTIGNTPEGFKQVVPKQSIPFVPVLNSDYHVEIGTTNSNVHYYTWWRPSSVNRRFRIR